MNSRLILFLKRLKNDIITFILRRMNRGPIMPGENLSSVIANQTISKADIESQPSFVEASPQDKAIIEETILGELTPLSVESGMGEERVKQKHLALPGQEYAEEQSQVQQPDNIIPFPVIQAQQANGNMSTQQVGAYHDNISQFPTAESRVKKPIQPQDSSNGSSGIAA